MKVLPILCGCFVVTLKSVVSIPKTPMLYLGL